MTFNPRSSNAEAQIFNLPTQSSTSATLLSTPELHEKMASIMQPSAGIPLRQIIGDPTPIGLMGFVMSLTPLCTNLMGWRGSVNSGAADIAAYFFFGGILMLVAGLMQLILNNIFMSLVFLSFGAFWLFFGGTLQPFFAAGAAYGGTESPGFDGALAWVPLSMGLLCFFFFICSLRINVAFVFLFFTVTVGLALLTGCLWKLAEGDADTARTCAKAAGAFLFACAAGGWYALFALMLPTVDFPIVLPLGDLSGVIPGRKQKSEAAEKSRQMDIASST